MVVHLQGEFRAGVDDDALDLKAVAGGEGFVAAPGAPDKRVLPAFLALRLAETRDNVLDFLRAPARRDEDGVLRFHGDKIARAQDGKQAVAGVQVAALRIFGQDVAGDDVAVLVPFARAEQGVP